MHFESQDIEKEISYFDEKLGKRITKKLNKVKLRKDAVPSKLPNCPSYLSRTTSHRESPDSRRLKKEENLQLLYQKALKMKLFIKKTRSLRILMSLSEKLIFRISIGQ